MRHLEWADRQIWDAVRGVPEQDWNRPVPSSYGSLAATVEHVFAPEWTWLQRLLGGNPATIGPPGGARDRTVLASMWPEVWSGLREAAAGRDPGESVPYRTTAGKAQVHTVGQIALHVALHSATYRGQSAVLMRHLGVTPPPTDLILLLRAT